MAATTAALVHRISSITLSEPIGLLSDIHGNLDALKAVLSELERRGTTTVLVAGDLALGGEQPVEVLKELLRIGARCVRGPSDMALSRIVGRTLKPEGPGERARAELFARTQEALGDLLRRRLGELPEQLRLPMIDGRELLLVHGSPADPFTSLGHELTDEEMLVLLDDDPADIIVCGSTHVPFQRSLPDVLVVNVGSVGQAPEGRFAHFTILTPGYEGAQIEQTCIEY
jgi:predicted phosphodiesterase